MRLLFLGLLLCASVASGAPYVPNASASWSATTAEWDCFVDDNGEEVCLQISGNGYAGASADYGSLWVSAEAEDHGDAYAVASFNDQITIFGGSGVAQIEWDFLAGWNGYYGTRGQYSLPTTFEFGVPFEIFARMEACAAWLARGGFCEGGGGGTFEIFGITVKQHGAPVSFTWEAASGTAYPFIAGGGPTEVAAPEPSTWILMAAPLFWTVCLRRTGASLLSSDPPQDPVRPVEQR